MSILFERAEKLGWRLNNSNPCLRLGVQSPHPRDRVATWDEINAMLQAARDAGLPLMALAILLALYAGQRQTAGLLPLHAEIIPALRAALAETGSAKAPRGDDSPLLIEERVGRAYPMATCRSSACRTTSRIRYSPIATRPRLGLRPAWIR